jgi:four helix bundle protein
MSTVKRFEDLVVWQDARHQCQQVFLLMKKERTKNDFEWRNQISRSSASVMDNIAEGFEKNNNKEFRNYLYIAKGSCGEVRSQLYRALDREYLSETEFLELNAFCQTLSRKLNAFIAHIDNTTMKGSRYNINTSKEPEIEYFQKIQEPAY